MSKKRVRPPQRCIRATAEEWKLVDEKVKQSGLGNFTNYARKMLLKDKITVISHFEVEAIKALTLELSRIGNNINQIAKIANSTNKVFKAEIVEIFENQNEIMALLRVILTTHKMRKNKGRKPKVE